MKGISWDTSKWVDKARDHVLDEIDQRVKLCALDDFKTPAYQEYSKIYASELKAIKTDLEKIFSDLRQRYIPYGDS